MYIVSEGENMVTVHADPIKNAMVPIQLTHDADGVGWIVFSYTEDERPWKWPKAVRWCDKPYIWMSFNSDSMRVYYKECQENEIARPLTNQPH
jgi:hypothetical protein